MEQPAESPGWAGNPHYVVDFDVIPARVAVGFNGETVAESDRARVMFELGHAPVYYLPFDDLAADRFTRTDHHSFCPYKGVASYWSLTVGDRTADNVVWCYEDPYPQLPELADYVGFYWGRNGILDRGRRGGRGAARDPRPHRHDQPAQGALPCPRARMAPVAQPRAPRPTSSPPTATRKCGGKTPTAANGRPASRTASSASRTCAATATRRPTG